MLSRTTTSIVTSVHPFVVAGYTDEVPSGGTARGLADPDGLAMAQAQDQIETTNDKNNKNSEAALSPSKD